MKVLTVHISIIAIIFSVSACQEKPEQKASQDQATIEVQSDAKQLMEKGQKVSTALLESLGPKLKAALKSGGPEHALVICEQLAQPSTYEVSDEFEGLTLSRVSLKTRNPENAADELDVELLKTWEEQLAEGGSVPVSELRYKDEQTPVYYRPIMTQEVCMKCHGDPSTFSKELTTKLAELYPDDKATGYRPGQLRGAFRIEFATK
ncbi:MAG: DUF3365 domain-containing protein [Verrucomicrobiae bacterium]|nr:DUF3365 domain-containing protein [Verrucomicrobiae bacterium]NNJ87618.1 DUF3365 domain-containing protein [Akkermansiaceae bacterium]